jgi:hypothetical protein
MMDLISSIIKLLISMLPVNVEFDYDQVYYFLKKAVPPVSPLRLKTSKWRKYNIFAQILVGATAPLKGKSGVNPALSP